MDEPRPADAPGSPFQGPHRPSQHAEPLPPDFVPLRLILQPSGLMVELTRSNVVVGRHSEADVRLPLPDVSRRHCRFLFGNGHWAVMDLNSLNGVYVNEEPVGQMTLKQGDRVRIGGFTFAVDLSREVLSLPDAKPDGNLADNLFHTRRLPNGFTPHRRAS
jgi:pSer/pThr/pTyr-binding forkhead associated (FHA) protein